MVPPSARRALHPQFPQQRRADKELLLRFEELAACPPAGPTAETPWATLHRQARLRAWLTCQRSTKSVVEWGPTGQAAGGMPDGVASDEWAEKSMEALNEGDISTLVSTSAGQAMPSPLPPPPPPLHYSRLLTPRCCLAARCSKSNCKRFHRSCWRRQCKLLTTWATLR